MAVLEKRSGLIDDWDIPGFGFDAESPRIFLSHETHGKQIDEQTENDTFFHFNLLKVLFIYEIRLKAKLVKEL
jgi:hypothetical protein